LRAAPEGKALLLHGIEALARGALVAGGAGPPAYPGTPSSEIADTFYELAAEAGLYFEYSTNEKVALEVAAGAAIANLRSIVSMKHVGLNVAADPLNTLAYTGVRAGMIIVTADDPSLHSSQNEQDNRFYAKLSLLPMLEPSSPQEALEMTREGFALSEKVGLPVLLRTTTRVNHARGVCRLGRRQPPVFSAHFQKDIFRWVPVPAVARRLRLTQLERQKTVREMFEPLPFNRIEGSGDLGIVASGVSRAYVRELIDELGLVGRARLLHVGSIHPLPRALLEELLKGSRKVLVVEELEPYLETEIRALAHELRLTVPIQGKGPDLVPRHYELSPDRLRPVLARFAGVDLPAPPAPPKIPALPDRPPLLCAGCTHRASYYAIKAIADADTYFASDIGCYTLGLLPPLSTTDSFLCMGASITQGSGASIRSRQKVVAFIGDSTFFHGGLPGLVNAVHNRHDLLLVILDNGTTAMTGHQPHPGTLVQQQGCERLDLERVVRGLGVDDVTVMDPNNLREAIQAAREAYRRSGLRVLISRHPCPLYERRVLQKSEEPVKYAVDPARCKVCGTTGKAEPCQVAILADDEILRSRARILASGIEPGSRAAGPAAKMDCAPCTLACPANICAMGYVSLARAGRFREALKMIRDRAPLPATLGRVCHHPCESRCVRGDYEGPVAINEIKRFLTERETDAERAKYFAYLRSQIKPNGKKMAVIGAGPAGLSAAYELARRGYAVTLFERERVAGGIPAWGIPAYRLPRNILQREIDAILSLGVELRLGEELGRTIRLKDLLEGGYAGVALAFGCSRGLRADIQGKELPAVVDALSFLREVSLGGRRQAGARTVVVGGGDAAIDAARTALRLGARDVEILYRRGEEEMPAAEDEIAAARAEGVRIRHLVQPVCFEEQPQGVALVRCVQNRLAEPDGSGRRRPEPIPGSEFAEPADLVILALGQEPELDRLDGDMPLERTSQGILAANASSGATSHPRVFVCGDLLTGPATVIEAIATGMQAAAALDRAVAGEVAEPYLRRSSREEAPQRYHPSLVEAAPREQPPRREITTVVGDFEPVSNGFNAAQALREADRCLGCGLCGRCNNCIDNFGCPAIVKEDGKIRIDVDLCVGCGVCAQLCANDAIYPLSDDPAPRSGSGAERTCG
jgi:indolepyruvate ferredoxin oxidoreductase alpha subunit